MKHHFFVLLSLASVACSAAQDGEYEYVEGADDQGADEFQPAGCPTIGPGCNLPPLPPLPPIPPPPPCATAPVNASLPAPSGTATFSSTSPDGNYGSSSCAHRYIVEFTSSDSAKRYTVPAASFQDLTVANDLGRAACERAVAEVKVLGFSGRWTEIRNSRYHGVVTPTACVAVADVAQAQLNIGGYSKIRTAVNRSWTFNGATQYIQATGSLQGL